MTTSDTYLQANAPTNKVSYMTYVAKDANNTTVAVLPGEAKAIIAELREACAGDSYVQDELFMAYAPHAYARGIDISLIQIGIGGSAPSDWKSTGTALPSVLAEAQAMGATALNHEIGTNYDGFGLNSEFVAGVVSAANATAAAGLTYRWFGPTAPPQYGALAQYAAQKADLIATGESPISTSSRPARRCCWAGARSPTAISSTPAPYYMAVVAGRIFDAIHPELANPATGADPAHPRGFGRLHRPGDRLHADARRAGRACRPRSITRSPASPGGTQAGTIASGTVQTSGIVHRWARRGTITADANARSRAAATPT